MARAWPGSAQPQTSAVLPHQRGMPAGVRLFREQSMCQMETLWSQGMLCPGFLHDDEAKQLAIWPRMRQCAVWARQVRFRFAGRGKQPAACLDVKDGSWSQWFDFGMVGCTWRQRASHPEWLLTNHVYHRAHHVVAGGDGLGIRIEVGLIDDHVDHFGSKIHIGPFNAAT
jgi:hypothetical protein